MLFRTPRRLFLGLLLVVWPAAGQSLNFSFSYRSAANPAPVAVPSAGAISFPPAALGGSTTATFIASNRDTVPWTIEASASGGPFLITSGGGTGQIQAGEDRLYGLSFSPANRGVVEGTLSVRLTNGTRSVPLIFFLTGIGQAPDLICSYTVTAEGNQAILGPNDRINFPPTGVGQSSTATLIVSNRGNGPGTLNAVSLTGGAFRLSGLLLMPAQIAADKDLRFSIVFAPGLPEQAAGSLRVELSDGSRTVNLAGLGTAATFTYEFMTDGVPSPVSPNGTISFPPAPVGSTSSIAVRIRNSGNTEGKITTIAIAGSNFQLAGLPVLPAVIPAGEVCSFTVSFSSTQSGRAEARLRIDSTVINLAGTGLGGNLSLLAHLGPTTTPVPDDGTVTFPNTAVGGKNSLMIQVNNEGNAAATVSSISLTGASFTLEGLPPLPSNLAPGGSLDFRVTFSPDALGVAGATVRIDNRRVNLTAVGVAPPPLPQVSFQGPGDTAEPAQQPAVGLSLAEPYPLDLTGKLTLSFTSDAFADDPAIQFSTGGRAVNFVVPANTTQAILGKDLLQVPFQTGTVAGTLTVTASFATAAVNLTPNPAPVKSLIVAGSAPKIRSVRIGTRTANSFEVVISGYSTVRSVSRMALQFTPSPGFNLQTTTLDVNVEAPFAAWYQGGASLQFGSQFAAGIQIQVAGDINAVQSVSVTAANQRGSSEAVSASLR